MDNQTLIMIVLCVLVVGLAGFAVYELTKPPPPPPVQSSGLGGLLGGLITSIIPAAGLFSLVADTAGSTK